MASRLPALVGGALVLFALTAGTVPSAAQEFPGWNPDFSNPSLERRFSFGLDVGKPLVFGATAGYNFSARASTQLGIASLGDFTALSGELRFNLLQFDVTTPVPFVTAGFTQYYLADGAVETSPTAVHAALGVEYMFLSYFGSGVQLGYLEALGGSQHPEVDRYGISDTTETVYFTFSGRYMF